MTLQQTIIFTALPRRVDTTKRELHLSVFVSPRLWADTAMSAALTLTDYPAWQDWPTTLASLKLQVMFEGGPTLDVTPDSTARSDVWQTIFTPTTPVIPLDRKSVV